MKKTLKIMIVFIVIIMVVFLTGCGKKAEKEKKQNIKEENYDSSTKETNTKKSKIIARKTIEAPEGQCKEEIIINFDNDKISDIEMLMEFEEEELAKSIYELFEMAYENKEGTILDNMKIEGKRIKMTMDSEMFKETYGYSDENMTKEGIKDYLENSEYIVE